MTLIFYVQVMLPGNDTGGGILICHSDPVRTLVWESVLLRLL